MKLSDYIAKIGNKAAADLFGVEETTAKAWRYNLRRPLPEAAMRIVAATNGEVSLVEALAPAKKAKPAKKAA